MNKSRHLDIGCGTAPRNPYHRDLLFACDLEDMEKNKIENGFHFKKVDLASEPLPFPDNYFTSISAFDVLEHIPRQAFDKTGKSIAPFINLMSEIYRVLEPNGLLLASTPAYPRPEAFQDPTHVNFITETTHTYFCGEQAYATRYGFKGNFLVKKAAWETQKNLYDSNTPKMRKIIRNIQRRFLKGGITHFTWELTAIK
jgi:SAM-dependent methyltransferase